MASIGLQKGNSQLGIVQNPLGKYGCVYSGNITQGATLYVGYTSIKSPNNAVWRLSQAETPNHNNIAYVICEQQSVGSFSDLTSIGIVSYKIGGGEDANLQIMNDMVQSIKLF